jgi:chromosome partitioning protein
MQPRTFDVWSVEQMAELVREARAVNERLRALAVLNAADAAGKDNDEAAVAVAETDGITCLDVRVVRRKAFPNAAATGRSVVEQAGQDPKAAAELAALVASALRRRLYIGMMPDGHRQEAESQYKEYTAGRC